jgi:Fe-S-cluster containining protein
MSCSQESGTCEACVGACKRKPGWFRPGEIEQTAGWLGISVQELFDTRLAIDWWEGDDQMPTTFTVAPALVGAQPGAEYPFNPNGRCTFLTDDDRCEIHEAKPYECRSYWCGKEETKAESISVHEETAQLWRAHQDQPTALLGRAPQLEDVSLLDIIGTLLS